MNKFIKNFSSIDKEQKIKIGLFLIPLIGIILKGIFLQCFIQSQDPYSFDLASGFLHSSGFLLYYLAFALVSLSFSFLFKGQGRVIYILVIDIFITVLTLLDVMYFRGFLTVPSVLILTQTANLDNLGGTVTSMLSAFDILLFLDLIILGIYIFLTRKSYKNFNKRGLKTFLLTLIIPLIYILYIPFNVNVLKNEDVKNAYLFDGMDPTNTTKYFTSLGYHIMDIYTVYRDSKPYELTEKENEAVTDYYNWKNENLVDNQYAGMSKNKNLIIIQVESLESFLIGKEINGKKITPVLDDIISKGLYFPNVYEQVNEGTSSDCDLMLNTSLLPLRRGSTFFRYPNNDYVSLPKILASNNYETASIHPDKGSFWNYANALKGGIGFENFYDYFSFEPNELIGMGLSDETYFNQVIPKLKELNSPFFAHTITLTNHGPFDLPKDKRVFNLNSELNDSELGGYIESVHYTDTQIGNFINQLKDAGLLDNSLIVITGDHGGVHKYYSHSIDSLSTKEDWYTIKDTVSTVPFIIYDTSIKESKTFDTIGGQIDIMPTILYALGIDSSEYENSALGRNLLNTNRSYAVTTNGTVFSNNLSDKEEDMVYGSLELSDILTRSNYFKDNK